MNHLNHSKNDNQDETESDNLNIDIKSRIAAFQSNPTNPTSSAPQYATYQPKKSPVLIRPTASTKPSTSSFNPKPKISTSPIQRQNSLPRDRDSNHSPSSASTSNSRNSNSNDFISDFGTIKGGSDVKASTFGGRSNAWNLGDGDNASSSTSSFHLTTQDDKQSKLRKSGSGLSLRELAVQSDAERRSRSNSTESRHFNQTSSPSRRGGGASSPAGSGSGSPRLGVKNIIALYGGNNSGGVLPGSLGRSSSPSSSNTTSSINRNRLGLGTSIPDASSSSDSVHIVKKRPPRHMLDASDDGSTSLQLHPTLCPSPTTSNHSPVRSGASSPAGDLFTSRQPIPRSPQLPNKPPAPPRPPKPSTSTTAPSTNTPPKLPSRFTVQPPTPSRNSTVDSATRRSSHSPTRVERAAGGSNTNGPFTAPLLPPRKVGSGSISAGVSPSSTGDGHSFNYQAYTSRNNGLKDQSSSNSSGPALPPRSNTNKLSKEESTPPRRSSADSASTSSKPPPPLPRRSMGTSSSAASDLSISSSNGSSTSINLIPPPPPRHKVQSSSNQSHHHSKSSISNFSSVSLTDDASAELKHSLESEIGDRSSLTGRNGLSSRGGAPLTPSNPLLPPPRAVRSLAQGAPSRTGGLGLAGNNSNFRFGSGSSQSSSPNRGRTLIRKNRKSTKRSYTPDPTSRARYENLFQRLLVAESIRKKKKLENRMEIDSGGSRSGISIPSSRRDLNRTITSIDDDDQESSGVQALKNRFDSNTATSRNNGLATSAPSERENSNPFLSNSSPSTSNLLQSHRYTNSAGPGLESTSSNPFIPIKRVEKLFKCSRLSNNFLSEIFSEIVKYQDGNQVKGLEKEPFIRGLTAIDHELARRQTIKQRRKDRIGNGGTKSGDENGVSRNRTIKGYQRPTPKPPNNSASSNANWSDATRLPKRVAPPPKPL